MKYCRHSVFRRAGCVLALAIWLLVAIPAAQARPPASAPALDVTLAWEGAVRIPGWTEVQVTLTASDSPWRGELRLEDRAQKVTYQLAVDLPARGRQHVRLPLYVAEYGTFSLTLAAPGEEPTPFRLPLIPTTAQARFCVAVDPLGRLAPGSENGCDESLLLTGLEPLPETPMAWDSIDVLLLHEVATTALSSAQQQALLAWVNLGGQLVITGGPGLAQTLAGLPQPLRQAAANLPPGTRRAFGAGHVTLVSQETGDATTSAAWLGDWRTQRVPAISLLRTALPLNLVAPTADALMQVPQSQIPRLSIWLLFLPLYAALIGPGAWLLARRLRRPRLVWALTPAGVVLATLGTWVGLTGIVAGAFPVTHEIAVIIGSDAQSPARVLQTTAIFAPRAPSLAWNTALAPRPFVGYVNTAAQTYFYDNNFPFPAQVVWEGQGSRISAERPPGPLTWAAEGLTTLPAIQVETVITTQQGRAMLSGVLHSAIPLREVRLIFEDGAHRASLADAVEAGTPLQIAVPLQALQMFDTLSTPFCSILSTGYFYPQAPYLPPGQPRLDETAPCYLTAITSGVPAPTRNSSATRIEESCLIVSIPCPTLASGGIPLFPRLDFESMGYGWLDDDGTLHLSGTTAAILRYLPLQSARQGGATPAAERLVLRFEDAPALQQAVTLELWDWSAGRWLRQPLPESGVALILEGETARAVLDPTEGLRVRLTPTSSDLSTVTLTVVLDPGR